MKSEWACDTCLYNMYRRDFIGRDYCYCKMHNCGAIRFKARECTLHALHWECGEDDGMNAKECSEAVGRFVKREDEAYADGFEDGWNERGGIEPCDIRRECVTCAWYVGKGTCAKRHHAACADWERYDA